MLSLERVCAPSSLLRLFPSSSRPRHFPKKTAEEEEAYEQREDWPRYLELGLFTTLEKSDGDDASPLTVFLNAFSPTEAKGREGREAARENAFVGATRTFPTRSRARQRGKALMNLCPLCREKTSSIPRRIVLLKGRRERFSNGERDVFVGFKV